MKLRVKVLAGAAVRFYARLKASPVDVDTAGRFLGLDPYQKFAVDVGGSHFKI
jgi:hypothetical protein